MELTCQLLYHGADPNTPNSKGFLPIELLPCDENLDEALNILFPYSFEDGCSVPLRTMTKSMRDNSSLFRRVLSVAKEVTYDDDDLNYFRREFIHIFKKNFLLFLDKFEHVVRASIDEKFLCSGIIQPAGCENVDEYAEVLDALFSKGCADELASTKHHLVSGSGCGCDCGLYQGYEPETTDNVITQFIAVFSSKFDEDEITKRVLVMVSYGLRVTLYDLNFVYYKYGHNELFRILLHVDVYDNVSSKELLSVMVFLHYKPRLDFQNQEFRRCLKLHTGFAPVVAQGVDAQTVDYPSDGTVDACLNIDYALCNFRQFAGSCLISTTNSLDTLFDYFNHDNLKEMCLGLCKRKDFVEKVKKLPRVSSLVELSRNVARRFIMDEFGVSSLKDFLTAVNRLPVDKTTKSILVLERKIY